MASSVKWVNFYWADLEKRRLNFFCSDAKKDVFSSDVRSVVAEARRRSGAAIDPLGAYRAMKVRETLIGERGAVTKATGL